MLIWDPLLLKLSIVFYSLALLPVLFGKRQRKALIFLLPALAANAAVVVIRYTEAWPMLPIYLNPVALPPALGTIALYFGRCGTPGVQMLRILLALAWAIALATLLFPKDFYLPFIKSQSSAAHLFFIFGVAGRACFLTAAAWALVNLTHKPKAPNPPSQTTDNRSRATDHRPPITDHRSFRWAIWGFAFWTLSMFTGELWSYLGWGTPLVWDDPAIMTAMATWFFYICLLHLHLTGTWTIRSRAIYTAAGAIVVLTLNCLPELGPFRWPL